MDAVFKKLNLKTQRQLLILHAPESFEPNLASLDAVTIHRQLPVLERIEFVLCFVFNQIQLEQAVHDIIPLLQDDAVLWFAYPKKSSKRYTSDIHRDSGWQVLGVAGYEGVRQVAIDADWSALRFRHTSYIKTLKRANKRALSAAGKQRTRT